MLIKLTGISGGVYLVNPGKIMFIAPYKTRSNEEASEIVFGADNVLRVSATIDEIAEKILNETEET